jgi:hypothetical protein
LGGWAAVILPSSILTNTGIHTKAREILLRYFYIKGIVELGSHTFMKTNANTVILFLERRDDGDCVGVQREVDQFFATKTDVTAAGVENAFSLYVSNVYEGLAFADKVGRLLSKMDGVQTKVPQKDILEHGEVPVVSQDSKKLILGYCDQVTPITDLPVVLMGDHTCVFKYVDFPFACGSDNTRLLKFDDGRIIPKFAYYILNNTKIQNQDKYERHFKYVKELYIPVPPLGIQRKFVSEMERLETEFAQINAKIQKL